ncbi:MAG: aminodeoxychorismate lyase [Candidatus Thiodiazotropha sp. 6PLUC2]
MLIDGQPADQIPLTDRGLQYGDGLFETIAIQDGRPCLWQRHMRRLQKGESALGFPPIDKELLWQEAHKLCTGRQQGVLKIVLTRGSGGRGYRPPDPCQPRRMLTTHPWPDYPQSWYDHGIVLRRCDTPISRQSRLAGIKHLNRLDQVLARAEWRDSAIVEGLMMDEMSNVISGTQSNIFLIKGDQLITPELSQAGIAGVVRELVLEFAGQYSLHPQVIKVGLDDLKQADALFITNSILGLCPVARFEDRQYDLSNIPSELVKFVENSYRADV